MSFPAAGLLPSHEALLSRKLPQAPRCTQLRNLAPTGHDAESIGISVTQVQQWMWCSGSGISDVPGPTTMGVLTEGPSYRAPMAVLKGSLSMLKLVQG